MESKYDTLEAQGLQYLSGYIYKSLMRFHTQSSCEACEAYAGQITSTTTEIKENEVFTMLKRYEEEKCTLASPSAVFTKFVGRAARLLGYCFQTRLKSDKIMLSLKQTVLEYVDIPPMCSDELEKKIVAHLVKTLFFHKLKRLNDEVKESGRNSTQSRQKLKILTHK